MPIEEGLPSFLHWLPWAFAYWLIVLTALAIAVLLLAFVVVAAQRGPRAAFARTRKVLADGLADLVRVSLRRVWTLAWLGVKESIRRRVVVGFAVFILILLFAGWFLDPGSPEPGRLYLSFVLTATSYLVLLLALFLSAFSLPLDIRAKTLHTVVTKPVRPSEIVLGRIVGFTLVGTGLLALMALISYGFVVQGLYHTHTLDQDDLQPAGSTTGDGGRAWTGKTSRFRGHRHEVFIDASGQGRLEPERNHWHDLTISRSGDQTRYQVSAPRGMLVARVPVYGEMRFCDREGFDAREGINVGDEWMYRGYIPGGTLAALVWTFDGINERAFPEQLPVEMTIGVFRTHKGDIEKGVLGSISVRNPATGLAVEVEIFQSKEFTTKRVAVPRKITRFSRSGIVYRKIETPQGNELQPLPSSVDQRLAQKREFDLFEDLVADGKVEVWLRCLEPGQYFGAAAPDLYLRAADAPFVVNFMKGYLGIWLQMVLVIGFGVMFSTFLSGPIAMIATSGVLVGGFFVDFMSDLARHRWDPQVTWYGGGPSEQFIRMLRQENLITDLGLPIVKMFDSVMEGVLFIISSLLPPFGEFSYADYVAYGFDVSPQLLLIRFLTALAFLLPVFVAGYFFLKTREVAR